jgi:signal transduction histidine kinase/DNA-binding response OmpR family regulator
MIMRKTYYILLCNLLICFLLTCCQKKTEKSFHIGFAQCNTNDSWRQTMLQGMERELSFNSNIEMEVADAKSDWKLQEAQINTFIKDKVDLLIVSPLESTLLVPVIEKAYEAGIPVLIIDRRIESDNYTAFIGAENLLVGQNAGMYADVLLKGKGNVLAIGQGPTSGPTIDRNAGFQQAIRQFPNITFQNTIWVTDGHFPDSLINYLKGHADIDLIFAHNDRFALIAYQVCAKLGLSEKVKIIGVDGLGGVNEGLDLVEKRKINATMLYPTGGEEAIQLAVKILTKKPFVKENRLFTTVIDPNNVAIMLAQAQKITVQQVAINRQTNKIEELTRTYSFLQHITYFISILLVILLILGGFILGLYRSKQRANQLLEEQNLAIIEQRDEITRISELAQKANDEKNRFYSYLSHEFRTPLSLILTPVEDIIQRKLDVKEVRSTLQLVHKNAHRLLRLVDQLLDLRKFDAGKMQAHLTEQDLVTFIKEIVSDFKLKARNQQIDLQFISQLDEVPFWFDLEKLDKIIFNLISNAFKYTPPGGMIHLTLLKNPDKVDILVADSGIGMAEAEKNNAFDLFYQGHQTNKHLGSGLGLALSKEFVLLHNGTIELTSEKGKGTTFKISLPIVKPRSIDGEAALNQPFVRESIEDSTPDYIKNDDLSVNTILLVEDNEELNFYLRQKLSPSYSVVATESAEQGWVEILNNIPDLIICDVMLPEMDGFSLTKKIKEDFRTSHIPVVLLTAKEQVESQVEGMNAGADDYVIKPFNLLLLEKKIKSLLDNRERMRRRFSSEVTNPSNIQKGERKFLIEFELLIEKHIKDSTLSVEKLSQELGMSRVQLFRKISALTNKNVTDYIADFKLLKAKALLKESSKTIAEIAYETGFNTPSYFTAFFKQKTNQTPTDWRNS